MGPCRPCLQDKYWFPIADIKIQLPCRVCEWKEASFSWLLLQLLADDLSECFNLNLNILRKWAGRGEKRLVGERRQMSGQMYFWQTHNGVSLSNLLYVLYIHNHHLNTLLGSDVGGGKTSEKRLSLPHPECISTECLNWKMRKGFV